MGIYSRTQSWVSLRGVALRMLTGFHSRVPIKGTLRFYTRVPFKGSRASGHEKAQGFGATRLGECMLVSSCASCVVLLRSPAAAW